MPSLAQKSLNSLEVYSPPLSDPQHFDFPPSLVLHKSFELLEPIEDLSFGLHEENPRLPREVINEYDIIQKPLKDAEDIGPHTSE
jgi:hypothetical protein